MALGTHSVLIVTLSPLSTNLLPLNMSPSYPPDLLSASLTMKQKPNNNHLPVKTNLILLSSDFVPCSFSWTSSAALAASPGIMVIADLFMFLSRKLPRIPVFNAFLTHRPVHLHVLVILGATRHVINFGLTCPTMRHFCLRIALFTCLIPVLHCASLCMLLCIHPRPKTCPT